jgi:hypothetical protein
MAKKRGRKRPLKGAGSGTTKSALHEATAARETFARMIREKQASVGDGGLAVLLALASVTTLVTVDTSTTPPTVTPANIGTLTFDDPSVGLTDEGMRIFKANLTILLPQIAADIESIPASAGLNIGKVAEFVQLSLMGA